MKWRIFALLLTLGAVSAEAEIYKWILPNGTIKYSDRPPAEGAEKAELRPLVTYTSPPLPAKSADTAARKKPAPKGYDRFTIVSPANEATIRDNAGNLSLNLAITPTLIQGHAIDVFVDGLKFSRSKTPVVTLVNVSRGSHQIYAVIVDGSGVEAARTQTITVYLQRFSTG